MSVVIYGGGGLYLYPGYLGSLEGVSYGAGFEGYYPWPKQGGVQALYLNKCVDGITGEWFRWKTFFQDRTGVYYLSSGGKQFDAGTYKVEAIIYEREQV
jgi:hypothetical protein